MTFILAGQRLYVPSRHLWLRFTQAPTSSITPSSFSQDCNWRIDVGMSHRGLEDIGDVQKYEFHQDINVTTMKVDEDDSKRSSARLLKSRRDDIVLNIFWDAHLITAADELYHTVWETISETTSITAPVDGYVEGINTSLLTKQKAGSIYIPEALDEDTTLFTLRTNYECIKSRMKDMCCEDEYQGIVQQSERGRFYEEDEVV